MNCPDCFKDNDAMRDYMISTDQLWCEFEADVIDGYLHLVYYCRHCSWHHQKKIDPEPLFNNPYVREEE